MEFSEKIKTLDELAGIIASLRKAGKKVVHCHGVFDLLHIGHIRYFEQARQFGDVLVVTVTPDRFVDKGPHRPAFNENLRVEAIASLGCTDYAAVNEWPTAEETLRLLRPDVYAKGSEFKDTSSDMTGKIQREAEVVKEVGAELAFTEDIVFSSSSLINRHLSQLPEEINQYLQLFRQRYDLDDVVRIIDDMSALKVLVIGDTILDEYQYCDAIGKSSKDPILALKYLSHDLYAGGVLAVANHVADFAGSVQLATVLGERESYEDFIRSKLHRNITPYFAVKPGAPTLIKRRFVDGYTTNKLFEVYVMDDSYLPPDRDSEVCDWLKSELPKYDLTVVSDFGHGTITDNMIKTLKEHSKFIAVNTQANAGNRGLHSVSRYRDVDYVCIAEHELRLEMRNTSGPLRRMMDDLGPRLGCSKFVVTQGSKGSLVWNRDGVFVKVPSFTHSVVDRVGAGDAFLSVTSLAAAMGVPEELLGFIGNCMGALACSIMGNKESIDKMQLQKYIVSMLK